MPNAFPCLQPKMSLSEICIFLATKYLSVFILFNANVFETVAQNVVCYSFLHKEVGVLYCATKPKTLFEKPYITLADFTRPWLSFLQIHVTCGIFSSHLLRRMEDKHYT